MTRAYLDTSAAGRLLVAEPESPALVGWLNADIDVVSSLLLETELRRLAVRQGIDQTVVSDILDGVTLYEVPSGVYRSAGLLPGPMLRSLDALHISVAVQLGADVVVTYDRRMQDAAAAAGLRVIAPV